MSRFGRKIEAVIHAIARGGRAISTVILFLMILLIGADVVGRYLFNNSIKGTLDIVEISLLFIVFLTVANLAVHKGHVRVTVVFSRFSQKTQAVINCFTSLLSLAIITLITWQMAERGWAQFQRPTLYTANLEIPIFPFVMVAALGSLILVLVLAADTVSYMSQAWRGKAKE